MAEMSPNMGLVAKHKNKKKKSELATLCPLSTAVNSQHYKIRAKIAKEKLKTKKGLALNLFSLYVTILVQCSSLSKGINTITMEEPILEVFTAITDKSNDEELQFLRNSLEMSKNCLEKGFEISEILHENSDDVDAVPTKRTKKRVQHISESDSDEKIHNDNLSGSDVTDLPRSSKILQIGSLCSSGSDNDNIFTISEKSRIQKVTYRKSETDTDIDATKSGKNEGQQSRMKNKRNKIKQKFKSLINSRKNESDSQSILEPTKEKQSQSSDDSNDEASSIDLIRKKIKERIISLKTTICDPDTSSDEESSHHKVPQRQKKERRSIKLTSPKPARMSAKQAMENMQLIKSESNRMLREQQVSLPYHRPKALLLKDIMNRRKPALGSDGKALPIKMNEEQLKQYASQLEQRQKEMMELCKSESEEDEAEESNLNDTKADTLPCIVHTCEEVAETDKANIQTSIDKVESDISNINSELINELGKENNEDNEDINKADIISSEQTYDLHLVDNKKENEILVEQDSSMELVYNFSIEKDNKTAATEMIPTITEDSENIAAHQHSVNESHTANTVDSQLISLHLDTEKSDSGINGITENEEEPIATTSMVQNKVSIDMDEVEDIQNDFSDDDINMDEIDSIIENAEILKSNIENTCSPMLIRDPLPLKTNPRLTGAPGMVIDLDGGDPFAAKKLTGVELLKERFTYFAKLKTPEEMERDREKKLKPGTLHLKLKQELEEKIAEQRSLEWAKRLEDEKQNQMELNALRGDASEEEDEIEKIKSKLEEDYVEPTGNPSESEEELIEDDICMKDKPSKNNPMVEDEAEESDCGDDNDEVANNEAGNDGESDDDDAGDNCDNEESNDESSDEESSESDNEETKPKRSRILKAFEDSDDEDASTKLNEKDTGAESANKASGANNEDNNMNQKQIESQSIKYSQDDELQLAQRHKSLSGDLFTSQESAIVTPIEKVAPTQIGNIVDDDKELGTQTFSILNSVTTKDNIEIEQHCTEKLSVVCTTQPYDDNLDAVAAMCSGNFTQNLVNTQLPITQVSQSQPIGEDILALCTGKFYDNQFISPVDENINDITQESSIDDNYDEEIPKESVDNVQQINNDDHNKIEDIIPELNQQDTNKNDKDGNLLKSILDELDEPDIDTTKVNKFFKGNIKNKDNDHSTSNVLLKKKFIIDSDDETNETIDSSVRKKKLKKKKPEKRALQISDDEDELELEEEEVEDYMSDIEDDTNRMVEYDSEENEVEIKPQNPKKKRKATDFFEQEAELTSEDEWVGSGDEDEADLDRMEREEGDDDTFHQGKLQRELGQIHMRDVLDQDKREVRIIQELMFEDGDLGDGHRQRKFRWRNADGEEETGTMPDEFADTQEEEFESEEQWRKERHEREIFLRQLKDPDEAEENPNSSVNRTSIIKANLMSKTMSNLLMEVNNSDTSKTESPVVAEKKTATDIPSPKKPFAIFKQSYHSSLLTRGRGALARLAALAIPLAVDDNDAPKVGSLAPTNRRNFVFTAVTPDDEKPKVTKRKADVNANTPRLVKKMKTEEKSKYSKSLLEQLKI